MTLQTMIWAKDFRVYFGTYTGKDCKGIYMSRFDSKNGRLTQPELAIETRNPTFLALGPGERTLYAVAETSHPDGQRGGAVSAFAINPRTGGLTLLNQQSTEGAGPCHVILDRSGKNLLAANYGSGSVSILPVLDDGRLGPATAVQHAGSSVHPKRQAGPHAHQAVVSPDNQFAFVCDLGLDKIMVYRIKHASSRLEPHTIPFIKTEMGAGPRHLVFAPDGKTFYVINELNSTMTVFSWDAAKAQATPLQTIRTVPEEFQGENSGAEVIVHPNGRFVYGSNRGHDSIACFEVDQGSGMLKLAHHTRSGGSFPRFITLDPTGEWLLSLNQKSGNVIVLKVNPANGRLEGPVCETHVGSPVCAVFTNVQE